jgi:hypothetical protein
MLVSRGLLEEPDSEDALAHLQAESLQAGLPWPLEKERFSSRLAVQLDGYSLEAGTHAHEHDRLALLHLCRYGLRAPFSQERLRVTDDGRVELELRRPARDGTRVVSFTPHQFLKTPRGDRAAASRSSDWLPRCLRSPFAPTPGRHSKAEGTCRPNEPVTFSQGERPHPPCSAGTLAQARLRPPNRLLVALLN